MISFIIIGRNLEFTISSCVDSVIGFIQVNNINAYELLYIDSDSSDNTLRNIKQYPIKVIIVRGQVNAAIGRNIGAKYAKGDIYFFIDGDMELVSDFYNSIITTKNIRLNYPFITGYLSHIFYNENFKYLYTENERIPDKPIYRNASGGLMLVESKFWHNLNGMDERFIRNQDLDFTLRMTKTGLPIQVVNHLFAFHHTINYFEKNRSLIFYFSKALFSPGLLMRKHLFNKAYLNLYYRSLIYVFILIATIIMVAIEPLISIVLFTVYTGIQLARTVRMNRKDFPFYRFFLFKILYSIYTLIGLLFYYPKQPKYHVIDGSSLENECFFDKS